MNKPIYKNDWIPVAKNTAIICTQNGVESEGIALLIHLCIVGAPADGLGGLLKYQSIVSLEDLKELEFEKNPDIYFKQLQNAGLIEYEKILDKYFIKKISNKIIKDGYTI